MAFNKAKALKAGYTEEEINNYLAGKQGGGQSASMGTMGTLLPILTGLMGSIAAPPIPGVKGAVGAASGASGQRLVDVLSGNAPEEASQWGFKGRGFRGNEFKNIAIGAGSDIALRGLVKVLGSLLHPMKTVGSSLEGARSGINIPVGDFKESAVTNLDDILSRQPQQLEQPARNIMGDYFQKLAPYGGESTGTIAQPEQVNLNDAFKILSNFEKSGKFDPEAMKLFSQVSRDYLGGESSAKAQLLSNLYSKMKTIVPFVNKAKWGAAGYAGYKMFQKPINSVLQSLGIGGNSGGY